MVQRPASFSRFAASTNPFSGTRTPTAVTAEETTVRGTVSSTTAHSAATSRATSSLTIQSSCTVTIFDASTDRSDTRWAGLSSRLAISAADRSSATSTACASSCRNTAVNAPCAAVPASVRGPLSPGRPRWSDPP